MRMHDKVELENHGTLCLYKIRKENLMNKVLSDTIRFEV